MERYILTAEVLKRCFPDGKRPDDTYFPIIKRFPRLATELEDIIDGKIFQLAHGEIDTVTDYELQYFDEFGFSYSCQVELSDQDKEIIESAPIIDWK